MMFKGIVGPHPEGILSGGISPRSLCICRSSALIQHPMLDVYGTNGALCIKGCRVILHLPLFL
jgi:hypothetical protein